MAEHGQVQLRLPVQPPSSPRRRSPTCGSTASHLSLRRFAQGYVFGTSSRIGPDSPATSEPHPTNTLPPSTTNSSPAFTAPTNTPNFASLAANQTSSTSTPANPSTTWHSSSTASEASPSPNRRRRPLCTITSATSGTVSSAAATSDTPSSSSSASSSKLPALPVRTRPIERRSVPKRCREQVTVDALAVMVESVLGNGATGCTWRARGVAKKMRPDTASRVQKPTTGPIAAFGEPMTKRNEEKSKEMHPRLEQKSNALQRLEDQDIDDELSFLVNKCELDTEGKQVMFMPYIT